MNPNKMTKEEKLQRLEAIRFKLEEIISENDEAPQYLIEELEMVKNQIKKLSDSDGRKTD